VVAVGIVAEPMQPVIIVFAYVPILNVTEFAVTLSKSASITPAAPPIVRVKSADTIGVVGVVVIVNQMSSVRQGYASQSRS